MIALKNESIWEDISRFGTPYAPFDFNSGMDVRDIDRATAVQLGLMSARERVMPQHRDFEDDMQSGAQQMSPLIQEALVESLGEGYTIESGVIMRENERLIAQLSNWNLIDQNVAC